MASHAYAHLPLLPVDQYLALFPDQSSLPEQELMPLRIDHEKQEREKLEQERLELVKVKEELAKENARRKEEMGKMDEKIEGVVEQISTVHHGLSQEL